MDLIKKIIRFFKKHVRIFGVIGAIAISALILVFKDKFIHLQGLGIFGIFILSILGNATLILPVPVVLTAFVGGGLYNPLLVAVVIALGATIGEMTGYLAGISGQEIIEEPKYKKVRKWMDKYGLWTVFVLAAIPNPLFDLAGIISGSTKIPVDRFFAVTFLGKIIKFILIAFLGKIFVSHGFFV